MSSKKLKSCFIRCGATPTRSLHLIETALCLAELFSVFSYDLSFSLSLFSVALALAIALTIAVLEKILVNSLFVILLDELVNNESNSANTCHSSKGDGNDLAVVGGLLLEEIHEEDEK